MQREQLIRLLLLLVAVVLGVVMGLVGLVMRAGGLLPAPLAGAIHQPQQEPR